MRSLHTIDVESSAISSVGYDEERRELVVKFTSGESYTYLDVPMEEWLALCEAESKGAHVNRRIKPRYEFRKGGPI